MAVWPSSITVASLKRLVVLPLWILLISRAILLEPVWWNRSFSRGSIVRGVIPEVGDLGVEPPAIAIIASSSGVIVRELVLCSTGVITRSSMPLIAVEVSSILAPFITPFSGTSILSSTTKPLLSPAPALWLSPALALVSELKSGLSPALSLSSKFAEREKAEPAWAIIANSSGVIVRELELCSTGVTTRSVLPLIAVAVSSMVAPFITPLSGVAISLALVVKLSSATLLISSWAWLLSLLLVWASASMVAGLWLSIAWDWPSWESSEDGVS